MSHIHNSLQINMDPEKGIGGKNGFGNSMVNLQVYMYLNNINTPSVASLCHRSAADMPTRGSQPKPSASGLLASKGPGGSPREDGTQKLENGAKPKLQNHRKSTKNPVAKCQIMHLTSRHGKGQACLFLAGGWTIMQHLTSSCGTQGQLTLLGWTNHGSGSPPKPTPSNFVLVGASIESGNARSILGHSQI